MSDIQLLIYSMKRVVLTFVFSLPEDVVPMESIVSIIIEFPLWMNANSLTNPKMYLVERDSALIERI